MDDAFPDRIPTGSKGWAVARARFLAAAVCGATAPRGRACPTRTDLDPVRAGPENQRRLVQLLFSLLVRLNEGVGCLRLRRFANK